jgi:hypothetical protein
LKDLADLPRVEDMAESLGIESSLLVERSPTEEQLPLSEPEAEPAAEESEIADADAADANEDATGDVDDDRSDEEPEPSVH